MKVKLFDFEDETDLEKAINKFLDELEEEIIDIQYQICSFAQGEEQIYSFSAMILYKK